MKTNAYLDQYTSQNEISKYTKETAGFGINYLLDHDYKAVYLEAAGLLPQQIKEGGIRVLEFGCGAGMNLVRLVSLLNSDGIRVAHAIGADFAPAMVETATREARAHLENNDIDRIQFHVAAN